MVRPKVTVIVPVYNVANYIEKCATSLFNQTLESLEIIFVDDCSPDNSVEIIKQTLEKFPERVANTRIMRTPTNSGQAAVRRRGIIDATGEYIIHCDGDDWADIDLYEEMYKAAKDKDADIVICDEIQELKDGQRICEVGELPDSPKEIVRGWYSHTIGMWCHNKLIRRNLYFDNDVLPWDGLDMWEDNGLMTRLLYYGKRLVQIHGSYYHYNRTNVNSLSSGYGIKSVEQMIGIATNLTEFFRTKSDSEDFEKTVMAFQFLARINLVTDSYKRLKRYNHTFVGSEKIMPELDPHAFSSKGLFRFRMVRYHLAWLFVLMFKVKNMLRK